MIDSTLIYIILFSLLGGVVSLIGGFFLLWQSEFTKKILVHLITFSAGTLLAVAFLDLLPEAFEAASVEPARVLPWTLAGILFFFLFERLILRLHTHDESDEIEHEKPHTRASLPALVSAGDAIHNFIDGIAITAGFLVSIPTGIITALAVAAHEIPQEIADFSIMLHGGMSRRRVAWLNVGAALMSTLGALTAYLFRDALEPYLAAILAFTAGIFIYIASSDLFPEIHHAHHNNSKTSHLLHITILLLAGVGLVWFLAQTIEQLVH